MFEREFHPSRRGDFKALTTKSERWLTENAVSSQQVAAPWRLQKFSEADVLHALRHYGFAVLPEAMKGDLNKLTDEFDRAFQDTPEIETRKPSPIEQAFRAIIKRPHRAAPETRQPYERMSKASGMLIAKRNPPPGLAPMYKPEFRAVADAFFCGEEYFFNEPVFLHHSQPRAHPIIGSHFDDRRNLKFFVYLNDVDVDDGAFSLVPQSHRVVTDYVESCDYLGLRARFRPNTVRFIEDGGLWMQLSCPNQKLSPIMPVETRFDAAQLVQVCESAGTLVIFDTNTVHRGGVVAPGHERKIIRANSRSIVEERRH